MIREDLPEIVSEHITKAHNIPFKWGEYDCALFVCDYLKAVHGKDYAENFRGKYKSKTGAKRALKEAGYKNLKQLVDETLEPVRLEFAVRGDVVMESGGAIGICTGEHSYFPAPSGVTHRRTLECKTAWSI